MSGSARPLRQQARRLPRPWDSPGKNTGVGSHFLLQCMKVKSGSEVAQSCPTLRDPMDRSLPGSSIHGMFQARVLEWGAIAFSDPSILMLNSLLCHKAFSDSLDRMNHFYAFSYLVCRGPSHFLRFCFRGNYVFSHFMDQRKGWALKTWCFWILVLEKTLESLLDSKEMKPVNPKGN